jgi:hypothetical protein
VDRYAHERKLLQEPVPLDHGLAGIFYLNPDAVVVVSAGRAGRLAEEVRARGRPVRVLHVRQDEVRLRQDVFLQAGRRCSGSGGSRRSRSPPGSEAIPPSP